MNAPKNRQGHAAPRRRLRAVTIWQPWAGLLARGIKPVENRSWAPYPSQLCVGDFLAIHAGAAYHPEEWRIALDLKRQLEPRGLWTTRRESPWPLKPAKPSSESPEGTPYGAIIGVAVFDGVTTQPRLLDDGTPDPFWFGPFGWYLRDPVPFAPLLCTGLRGLWTPDDALTKEVRRRYTDALGAPAAQG